MEHFAKGVAAAGIGYLLGISRKADEADEDYAERVMIAHKAMGGSEDFREGLLEKIKGEQK